MVDPRPREIASAEPEDLVSLTVVNDSRVDACALRDATSRLLGGAPEARGEMLAVLSSWGATSSHATPPLLASPDRAEPPTSRYRHVLRAHFDDLIRALVALSFESRQRITVATNCQPLLGLPTDADVVDATTRRLQNLVRARYGSVQQLDDVRMGLSVLLMASVNEWLPEGTVGVPPLFDPFVVGRAALMVSRTTIIAALVPLLAFVAAPPPLRMADDRREGRCVAGAIDDGRATPQVTTALDNTRGATIAVLSWLMAQPGGLGSTLNVFLFSGRSTEDAVLIVEHVAALVCAAPGFVLRRSPPRESIDGERWPHVFAFDVAVKADADTQRQNICAQLVDLLSTRDADDFAADTAEVHPRRGRPPAGDWSHAELLAAFAAVVTSHICGFARAARTDRPHCSNRIMAIVSHVPDRDALVIANRYFLGPAFLALQIQARASNTGDAPTTVPDVPTGVRLEQVSLSLRRLRLVAVGHRLVGSTPHVPSFALIWGAVASGVVTIACGLAAVVASRSSSFVGIPMRAAAARACLVDVVRLLLHSEDGVRDACVPALAQALAQAAANRDVEIACRPLIDDGTQEAAAVVVYSQRRRGPSTAHFTTVFESLESPSELSRTGNDTILSYDDEFLLDWLFDLVRDGSQQTATGRCAQSTVADDVIRGHAMWCSLTKALSHLARAVSPHSAVAGQLCVAIVERVVTSALPSMEPDGIALAVACAVNLEPLSEALTAASASSASILLRRLLFAGLSRMSEGSEQTADESALPLGLLTPAMLTKAPPWLDRLSPQCAAQLRTLVARVQLEGVDDSDELDVVLALLDRSDAMAYSTVGGLRPAAPRDASPPAVVRDVMDLTAALKAHAAVRNSGMCAVCLAELTELLRAASWTAAAASESESAPRPADSPCVRELSAALIGLLDGGVGIDPALESHATSLLATVLLTVPRRLRVVALEVVTPAIELTLDRVLADPSRRAHSATTGPDGIRPLTNGLGARETALLCRLLDVVSHVCGTEFAAGNHVVSTEVLTLSVQVGATPARRAWPLNAVVAELCRRPLPAEFAKDVRGERSTRVLLNHRLTLSAMSTLAAAVAVDPSLAARVGLEDLVTAIFALDRAWRVPLLRAAAASLFATYCCGADLTDAAVGGRCHRMATHLSQFRDRPEAPEVTARPGTTAPRSAISDGVTNTPVDRDEADDNPIDEEELIRAHGRACLAALKGRVDAVAAEANDRVMDSTPNVLRLASRGPMPHINVLSAIFNVRGAVK